MASSKQAWHGRPSENVLGDTMAEVKNFEERHIGLVIKGDHMIISVSDVRKIANGVISIAEMDDPEATAQAIAVIAMESINGN